MVRICKPLCLRAVLAMDRAVMAAITGGSMTGREFTQLAVYHVKQEYKISINIIVAQRCRKPPTEDESVIISAVSKPLY